MLPPKPRGSTIEESRTDDALTLRWPMPSAGVREYLSAVAMIAGLAYLVYLWAGILMRPGPGGGFQWIYLVILLPVVFGAAPSLQLLRGSRPESVTLGPDYFRHDLGRATGYLGYADTFRQQGPDRRSGVAKLFAEPLVLESNREEMGPVVLEKDRGLRLRYDLGADRVEIGRYLREPEREWLAEVIKRWQDGTPTN
jgi:hypothetical protein